jgi:uncharacterized coiled-coil protein SlyX
LEEEFAEYHQEKNIEELEQACIEKQKVRSRFDKKLLFESVIEVNNQNG